MNRVWFNRLWYANEKKSSLLYWLGVLILLAVPAFIWWWLRPREGVSISVTREPVLEKKPKPKSSKPDDLKRITGIGPKVKELLISANITSFTDLAALKPEGLRQILEEAGLYMINPDSWPEQAKLASRGEWKALETLQGKIRGA